jgi:hypothetical protein
VRKRAAAAAADLSAALRAESFAGWDPYDALSSPWLRSVARTRILRWTAVQALKRLPVNLRPLLGVPKQRHTKALALLVSAYGKLGGEAEHVAELADEVGARAISGTGVGWGYDFDVQTRWGYYRAGRPNAVVTTFAANALLDAGRHRELVDGALEYARSELFVEPGYFAYFAGSARPIHNASLLVTALFARARVSDDAAERALAYSLERQRADGSWPYGEGPGLGWVDGYHTVYMLESLAQCHEASPDPALDAAIRRGLDLYLTRLVDPDGAPRATLEARYPLDIHAAASGVNGLCKLRRYDERAAPTAERMLGWALREMRRPDGRFAFQRHRLYRNSVPYIRWSDAHMLLALGTYLAMKESA